jgi:hypothetical protein
MRILFSDILVIQTMGQPYRWRNRRRRNGFAVRDPRCIGVSVEHVTERLGYVDKALRCFELNWVTKPRSSVSLDRRGPSRRS